MKYMSMMSSNVRGDSSGILKGVGVLERGGAVSPKEMRGVGSSNGTGMGAVEVL